MLGRPIAAVPQDWRAGLVRLGAVWLGLIALFWPDWRAMAHQWWDSSTYNHILMVPVILGWLVAQRLPDLLRVRVQGWAPGLALMAGAVLLWALGALASFAQITQAGAVAMLMASVPLLLGPRVATALAFPLFYMVFLVPFGDDVIPLLQTITAKLTVALVRLSAIRAQIDGVFINTPAGLFEVAEACSGVKFLVAMVAFGALTANVCFIDWRRRAAFMVLCVVVPVLANGVRAWGTVYVAQFYGRDIAGGVDHIIYGWIFFALVITAIIGAGWRFFDRPAGQPMIDVAAIEAAPWLCRITGRPLAPAKALGGMAAMALAAQGWAMAADRLVAPMPGRIDLPQVAGWQRAPYTPRQWWEPRAGGADHRLLGRYADGDGHVVDVFYALYAAQGPGKKAGGFGEGALPPDTGWAWQAAGPIVPDAKSDRLLAGGPTERLAETTYRTGDLATGSNLSLKLANIEDRLLLRQRPTMMLILSAEEGSGPKAAQSIAAFRASAGPIGSWMDRIGKVK
jgi:exosortase A